MRPSCVVLATCTVLACWSSMARADDSTHDKAVAAFQEGRRYIEAGNCDAAVTKLRESLSFESSVGARLSLAECLEKSDPLAAWRLLKDAANLAFVNHDDRFGLAESHAASLEKRLSLVRVTVPPSVIEQPGFELRIDGELVDRFYYRNGIIATKPGKHVVEATAPHRHWSERVTTDTGGATEVKVQLESETCSVSPSSPAVDSSTRNEAPGSGRRTLGIVLGGVGIAGLASGVVFGVLTLNKKSKIDELCGGNAGSCNAPPGSVDPERESAKTTATISTASFIVGGLGLVGGGLLYFTAPSGTGAAQVRVVPRAATNGGGLGLEGVW
jgi:hypothetical protein